MLIQYGMTQHFTVFYDSTFTGGPGQVNGPELAQNVLDYCEYDLARLSMLFGIMLTTFPIAINLVTSGNNNNGLNNIDSSCNVNTLPGMPPTTVVAELAEIFMVSQNKGWISGWSNGEALSRVCAGIFYPGNAWLFCSGQNWLDAGRPDWIDNVKQTDGDYVSFGCGILFLYYLANQLNYQWPNIIGAGAPTTNTLAETAEALGVTNAWTNFISLISTYLPPGAKLPTVPTSSFGPQPTDNAFPLGPLPAQIPALYMRHNLADNGTSHTGSLSDSPDIILKNNPVPNPQATFSTAASVASDTESDPDVLTNQDNYVYARVWNRGADAENVFATVYWAQPSTLVTPNTWNLIGTSYFPKVPGTSAVQVSSLGITWPADVLPGIGHNCFIATVGNSYAPAPSPTTFASYNDFVNYIYAHNNITWRNFNVVSGGPHPIKFPGGFMPLRFLINGAWDESRLFRLETHAELPEGSRMALQVPTWLGRGLKPAPTEFEELDDAETDPENRRRLRLTLRPNLTQHLGEIELPANTAVASHMLVLIPAERHVRPYKVIIRQLDREREVGRITWLILPPR